MREILLVRYGEIFLKGQNRPFFMNALVKQVQRAVKPFDGHAWLHDGRIFVDRFSDMEECLQAVTKVFGVHSVCPAIEMEKDSFDAIADHYGRIKDYFASLCERDLDFFNDGSDLERLGQALYRLAMFKSVLQEKVPEITDEELREIENEAPGYNAACNACFWNDVLDMCTCGMSYRHICHRFHINAEDFDEEKKLIERAEDDSLSGEEIFDAMQKHGLFVLISSTPK